MRRMENLQRISYRFLHEATNPLSFRFLREATGREWKTNQKRNLLRRIFVTVIADAI